MDLASVIGLVMAMGAFFVGYIMEGGNLVALLWHPSALIIIVGGTIGMTMAGVSMHTVKQIPKALGLAFFPSKEDAHSVVDALSQMAEKARKEGLLALQDDISRQSNPLLVRGLTMIVDGTDPDAVKETLAAQVDIEKGRIMAQAAVLEAAGGYSPTAGIVGTVMGLIVVLGNLGGSTEELGHGIAAAFAATFFGILLANAFWLPIGNKVKLYAKERAELGHMIITGLVSLQTGENPRTMREKLEVYLGVPAAPGSKGGEG